MPVRSRGSLLAGTAALAGLIVAGLGCHSSYSDHDSFSIPKTPPQSGNFLSSGSALSNGGFLSSPGNTAIPAGYPAQPMVQYAPARSPAAAARPVLLQSVPVAQSTTNLPVMQQTASQREVIASSWSPVQRVSAEQPVSGPDMQGNMPMVSANTPAIPARLPMGAAMPGGSGPVLDGGESTPSANIVLPAPRPLGSTTPPMFVGSGVVPPPPPHENVPREFEKMALPPYVVEPPDILLIQASNRVTLRLQPIVGQHLVGPDGTVNLGIYGKIRVAGLTLDQVADAVAARLLELMPGLLRGVPEVDDKGMDKKGTEGNLLKEFRQDFTSLELVKKELMVDVLVYNSKFYYVITDGGGYGQQVYPFPIRGNETVLDALANVNGLPAVASKKRVWVARATRAGQPPKIMPVDWMAVAQCGQSETNYQLFPGDRVYVDSNHLIKADTFLSKLYSPVLRTFGVTLLGAATVNTIKGTSSGLGAGAGLIR
jgi:polysaccharide export outer membrane protein